MPNILFYQTDVLIYLFEVLGEPGVNVELKIVQFGLQGFEFFFDIF